MIGFNKSSVDLSLQWQEKFSFQVVCEEELGWWQRCVSVAVQMIVIM